MNNNETNPCVPVSNDLPHMPTIVAAIPDQNCLVDLCHHASRLFVQDHEGGGATHVENMGHCCRGESPSRIIGPRVIEISQGIPGVDAGPSITCQISHLSSC